MKFSYEDMLSGDPIFVNGVGHIRSPFLRELKPCAGIGHAKYNQYLHLLSLEKDDIFQTITLPDRIAGKLKNRHDLLAFDIITLFDNLRELLQEAMAFFLVEDLAWESNERKFQVINSECEINRSNYEAVRDMMLQMNYINLDKDSMQFSSEKSKRLWELAQKRIKEEGAKASQSKKMRLGNIISKLSVASKSYNLLNIYDLTIFQLYDQFIQCNYLRAMNLNEMAYSNHGGDQFDLQDWLNPIIKL